MLFPVLWFIIKCYFLLLRSTHQNREVFLSHLAHGGKGIVVLWHQRLVPFFASSKWLANLNAAAIASASRDGDFAAMICRKLGIHAVRGSSSYKGKEAMNELLEHLRENNVAVHILDGPTGPPGKVKKGIVRIAQKSGAMIFPLSLSCRKVWRIGSWDRMFFPKPLSLISVAWGKPLSVPPFLSSEEFKQQRQKIEEILSLEQDMLDKAVGCPYRVATD